MAKAKTKKEVKGRQVKSRKGKVAFVLMVISVILLLINGSLLILGRNWFAAIFGGMGYSVSANSFITYGIIWIVLAVLMWVTTVRISKRQIASEKWLLLALSIITVFAGRLESGILALIAAIIYLTQK